VAAFCAKIWQGQYDFVALARLPYYYWIYVASCKAFSKRSVAEEIES
jgi:hypothetical protein